ncbi:MAG: SnoaL-like domain-containing protein, partial [Polyangiaceae bacterium]|nr:SnoaL-like domain-containing protein [Polyangiaceae bacterium]
PFHVVPPAADASAAPLPPGSDAAWLEPCPDAWLEGSAPDPGALYALKESVALAFVAALQCLSASQRAVLLLCDVLGMTAEEAASALGTSPPAVRSGLHRARVALRERVGSADANVVDATSEVDPILLRKYIQAWETLDLDALVVLLAEDVTVSMPPSSTWLRGVTAARTFLGGRPFVSLVGATRTLVPVGANGQPAVAFYVGGELHAVHVLRLRGGRIVDIVHFRDEASFAAFTLPRTLGASVAATEDAGRARAVADLPAGVVLATVVLGAAPERVFRALASAEITRWWERPGVFDTREWHGDVRTGGRWSAAGEARGGHRYVIEGEFLEVDAPRKLVHTWHRLEAAGAPTTVTYLLEADGAGTRLTLRHGTFTARATCEGTALGWETSLERLAAYLSP